LFCSTCRKTSKQRGAGGSIQSSQGSLASVTLFR
jgi:hypothetical protein